VHQEKDEEQAEEVYQLLMVRADAGTQRSLRVVKFRYLVQKRSFLVFWLVYSCLSCLHALHLVLPTFRVKSCASEKVLGPAVLMWGFSGAATDFLRPHLETADGWKDLGPGRVLEGV